MNVINFFELKGLYCIAFKRYTALDSVSEKCTESKGKTEGMCTSFKNRETPEKNIITFQKVLLDEFMLADQLIINQR